MLTSCFGLPLRTGTRIIAIANVIESVCYIVFNIWQHFTFSKQLKNLPEEIDEDGSWHTSSMVDNDTQIDVMLNSITLTLLATGFTWLFANFGLQYATFKNATHKIYLWLLVTYVQLGVTVIIECAVLIRCSSSIFNFIGFVVCFLLIDAFIAYKLLVVHSFYADEKLTEEHNYSQLVSRLTMTHIEEFNDDELQQVELN